MQRRLQRERDMVRAIDFFPGDASLEAEAAWTEFTQRIERVLSPDEPHETAGGIARLDASSYQGRTWATRRRPWVDRVASAWLIQRFIDRDARFQWLSQPSDCPKGALGFDFDGAAFTHVGERVTFETLMASFDLEQDAALMRVAALVHQLDEGSFWSAMQASVDWQDDIMQGAIKSLIFALVVTWIALFNGYDAKPTSAGISQATTRTVVHSSLAVLGLDFILTAVMFG